MKHTLFILFLFISMGMYVYGEDNFGRAQWIGATKNKDDSLAGRSVILSKIFSVSKNVKSLKIYICGLGQYELYIDGRKMEYGVMLAPAWSDYSKTVYYNIYSLPLLKSGKHHLDVLLGNGFYHEEGLRYHKLKSNYGPLTLLARLDVVYENGKRQPFVSDSTWTWRKSPVIYNSIYGGEDYDATFKDFSIHRVDILPAPKGKLREQLSFPVRIMEHYRIARRVSDRVFDMGQNLAGFPEFSIRGRRGQVVRIWVGESLGNDGRVTQKQTGKPYYYTYILKGKGTETWHPHFSYYGFQYIQVDGAVMKGDPNPCHLPVIDKLQSDFIYNSAAKTGSFECSNPLFNATYRIIDRAVRSNWMSIWTDCPHREKLGWLEQDWLNGEGLVYNYDCRKMLEQEMQVIVDAQHKNGSMPEIAPEYIAFHGSWAPPFQESPEWGGAIVALPFLYARHYGDSTLIRKFIVPMYRYIDYLSKRDSCGILRMGLGDWYDFGPGKAGFAKNTPISLVATAHYYLWTKMLASLDNGMKSLDIRADSIKTAFIQNFELKSQAAYAIALDLGLYKDGEKQVLLDKLIADIHRHGNRLTTGDVGTRYLFKVLLDNGQDDLLYKMLNHYDVPGYGAQLKKGMTTLTEQWDPDLGASRNHFMLGHINNHLIQDMAGIHIYGDSIVINPRFIGGITWARGSTMSSEGRVQVFWKICERHFLLNIITPDKGKTKIDYPAIKEMCHRKKLRLLCRERTSKQV